MESSLDLIGEPESEGNIDEYNVDNPSNVDPPIEESPSESDVLYFLLFVFNCGDSQ